MSFGLEVFSQITGRMLINGSSMNMATIAEGSGTSSASGAVSIGPWTDYGVRPLIFVKSSTGFTWGVDSVGNTTATVSAYSGSGRTAAAFSWRAVVPFSSLPPANTPFGLEIFNASGQRTWSSAHGLPNLVGAVSLGHPPQPSSSVVAAPAGTQAGPWLDMSGTLGLAGKLFRDGATDWVARYVVQGNSSEIRLALAPLPGNPIVANSAPIGSGPGKTIIVMND